ncbi:LPXTG cell wall anchor domain-containing protein [Carnobacterium gallinarum]|uniref:LPXTG cell wall anchor domain-containing protein n=1 Tax=Carnobacterium gallinarum TaxID=2749 RepID=UPI000556AA65|nr:LPXTG cell wall anchor domain-containing protein [Carnobacterium gallinarum]
MKRIAIVLCTILLFSFSFLSIKSVNAASGTESEVGIYFDEVTIPNPPENPEPPATIPPTKLPNTGGKLPQTGVQKSQSMNIAVVLFMGVALILWRKSKKEQTGEKCK